MKEEKEKRTGGKVLEEEKKKNYNYIYVLERIKTKKIKISAHDLKSD